MLGYHGCERETGIKAICRETTLVAQARAYHWLGSGIYFWENDQDRALEWATEKKSRGEIKEPFVIGAIIDLGNCLDLHVKQNFPIVKAAFESFEALQRDTGLKMPKNKKAKTDDRDDNVLRFLDCAVINHLHALSKEKPFDTVRGLFVEGEAVFPGAGIFLKTHSEIAVCNPDSIIGLFLPR